MPFIPTDFSGAVEPKPVPLGRYDVVISSAEDTLTKGGDGKEQKPQIKCMLLIEGHDDAPAIFHYIGTPSVNDKDGGKFQTLLFKRFMAAFKQPLDENGIDTEALAMSLPGSRANLELKQQVYNEMISNVLVIPALKADEGPQHAGKG